MFEDEKIQSRSYVTDAPIERAEFDRFDRGPFAKRIAETITMRTDPSCIIMGIYGPWGDGKTSTLNFISEALSTHEQVVCVTFNPWRIAGEDALLQSFFATLAGALSFNLRKGHEKVGDLIKQYSFLLKPVPMAGGFDGVATGLGTVLSNVSLDDLRKRISEALQEAEKR